MGVVVAVPIWRAPVPHYPVTNLRAWWSPREGLSVSMLRFPLPSASRASSGLPSGTGARHAITTVAAAHAFGLSEGPGGVSTKRRVVLAWPPSSASVSTIMWEVGATHTPDALPDTSCFVFGFDIRRTPS